MKTSIDNLSIELRAQHYTQLSAIEQGVTVVPLLGMTDELLSELRADAARQTYYGATPNTTTGVTQNFVSCGEFDPDSLWTKLAEKIASQLNEQFTSSGQSRMFSSRPIEFTDLALQRYPQIERDESFGISPHRDQSGFVNLVVVLLISGPSAFYVCKDKKGAGAGDVVARAGDLIIMRGGGYGGDLPRPYHFIGKIKDPRGRLSFGMRQVSTDPEAARRLREVFAPRDMKAA